MSSPEPLHVATRPRPVGAPGKGLKCRTVSDLLEAASSALGTPTALVQRSAAARAAANGTSTDEVLSAWAGGGEIASAPPAEVASSPGSELPVADQEERPPVEEDTAPPAVEAPVVTPSALAAPTVAIPEPEPDVALEPVALGDRVRTAVRVGAWTGAGLGLVGFLAAGAFWASAAVVAADGGPVVVEVQSPSVVVGVALVSILFGAVVASMSRAAASWRDPAMQLSSSRRSTVWIGAVIGLVLGVGAAALLTAGFGVPVEAEPGLVQLPVLATLGVMLVGGAVLGAITAAIPQLLGTPVALGDEDLDEVTVVRTRLRDAIGVPVAGLILLAVLVLPFAYALLESNHLTSNGAAVVAIITAAGILGFAALSGNRPNVRVSLGELMVAVVGIGTVLLILLAVLAFRANDLDDDDSGDPETAVVWLV